MATVVVGVDSSEGAKRALAFALEESRLRGATLLAVHAWSFPAIAASAGMFAPPVEFDFEELKRDAEQSLNTVIDEVVGTGHGVEIERKVVEGAAAQVLTEEARGADLLVVGSRGHGGFTGLLLGSVSQQAAHHAPCPVVIVPPKPED
jgi:nucleotide-binding universal stress UspA family protein